MTFFSTLAIHYILGMLNNQFDSLHSLCFRQKESQINDVVV